MRKRRRRLTTAAAWPGRRAGAGPWRLPALRAARARRGALEIEMPERRVVIGETGDIEAIGVRAVMIAIA